MARAARALAETTRPPWRSQASISIAEFASISGLYAAGLEIAKADNRDTDSVRGGRPTLLRFASRILADRRGPKQAGQVTLQLATAFPTRTMQTSVDAITCALCAFRRGLYTGL